MEYAFYLIMQNGFPIIKVITGLNEIHLACILASYETKLRNVSLKGQTKAHLHILGVEIVLRPYFTVTLVVQSFFFY